jgi:signal transduction histidine kinase
MNAERAAEPPAPPERVFEPAPPVRPAWLSKLSHDLRNQLSPIRTATQLLQSGRLDSDRQAEMLEMIERQIQRMVRMLDDVSEYGRLGVESKLEVLHLDYVVDSALGQIGQRITAAGHAFEHHLPEARVRIVGDRARLVQMFVRLFDNAIRFTPGGGHLSLSIAHHDRHAEVVLRDSGPGIEAERLERIFELPEGPRAAEGLGISLLLARACAREHGGDLEARSEGPGKGSEFVVRLPVVAA